MMLWYTGNQGLPNSVLCPGRGGGDYQLMNVLFPSRLKQFTHRKSVTKTSGDKGWCKSVLAHRTKQSVKILTTVLSIKQLLHANCVGTRQNSMLPTNSNNVWMVYELVVLQCCVKRKGDNAYLHEKTKVVEVAKK